MKKIFFLLLFVIAINVCAQSRSRYRTIDMADYGTRNSTTINSVLTAIGTNEFALIFDGGGWTISSDVSFPSNVLVNVSFGSQFVVSSNITVTLSNCVFAAGPYQIASGPGDVVGTPKFLYAYSEWGSNVSVGTGIEEPLLSSSSTNIDATLRRLYDGSDFVLSWSDDTLRTNGVTVLDWRNKQIISTDNTAWEIVGDLDLGGNQIADVQVIGFDGTFQQLNFESGSALVSYSTITETLNISGDAQGSITIKGDVSGNTSFFTAYSDTYDYGSSNAFKGSLDIRSSFDSKESYLQLVGTSNVLVYAIEGDLRLHSNGETRFTIENDGDLNCKSNDMINVDDITMVGDTICGINMGGTLFNAIYGSKNLKIYTTDTNEQIVVYVGDPNNGARLNLFNSQTRLAASDDPSSLLVLDAGSTNGTIVFSTHTDQISIEDDGTGDSQLNMHSNNIVNTPYITCTPSPSVSLGSFINLRKSDDTGQLDMFATTNSHVSIKQGIIEKAKIGDNLELKGNAALINPKYIRFDTSYDYPEQVTTSNVLFRVNSGPTNTLYFYDGTTYNALW